MAATMTVAVAPQTDAKTCDDIVDILQDLHVLLWQHKEPVLDDKQDDVSPWKEHQMLPAKVTPSFQLVAAPTSCLRQQIQMPLTPPLPQKLLDNEWRTSALLSPSSSSNGEELPGFSASVSLMNTPRPLVSEGAHRPQKPQAQPPKPKSKFCRDFANQAASFAHAQGTCKPCLFHHKGVCFRKSSCALCHLPHDAEQIRHVRPSKNTRQCLEKRDVQRKQDLERKYGK
eukprot:CAMPEP_0172735596 /NCGR_PEP_ID=MMETSP1074-20121228/112898_1 /TAXON_ID=2916 /ORGANISM="Ceratium fusus, Strain PA161109" /LENGTH=227 /DNA_ID=CAMNT_0013564631 /DNA_START=13 /DNA_END=696 /DNA_ORIENTATION=+